MSDVEKLLALAHDFTEAQHTDYAVLIVSPETFARVMSALTDIKVDKTYSEGKLGSHIVRSDTFLSDSDSIITWWPPEMPAFKPGIFLPEIKDPFEDLRKKLEKSKKFKKPRKK